LEEAVQTAATLAPEASTQTGSAWPLQEVEEHVVVVGGATHAMLQTPFKGQTAPLQQHEVPLVQTCPPHTGMQVMFHAQPDKEVVEATQLPTVHPALVGGRAPQED